MVVVVVVVRGAEGEGETGELDVDVDVFGEFGDASVGWEVGAGAEGDVAGDHAAGLGGIRLEAL